MRIFAPLRDRALARLWGGQVLSALGDEVNRVATVWLAARYWGAGAGRLLALHAACSLVACLVADALVRGVHRRRVLIVADAARAVAVLAIPIGAMLGAPTAPLLVASVAACAMLGAVFEPAIRAWTVELLPSASLRAPTNALMESTVRFARVLGPGLVAVLAAVAAPVQYFALDALTFVVSALSIASITGPRAALAERPSTEAFADTTAWRALLADPLARFTVVSGAISAAAWWLMLPLGMELLLAQRVGGGVRVLADVMLAYGAGNLASNLLAGNLPDRRPERLLFAGRVIAGAGFLLFVLAPGARTMFAAAALAAAGGPLTDVGFLGVFQSRFAGTALERAYRANLAVVFATMFALFFAAPWLYRAFGPAYVGAGAALTIAATGLAGFARFRAEPTTREGVDPVTPISG